MKFNVDVVRIRENSIQLNGWAIGKTPEAAISYDVEDENHKHLDHKYVATRRDDVSQIYFGSVIDKPRNLDSTFSFLMSEEKIRPSGDSRRRTQNSGQIQ